MNYMGGKFMIAKDLLQVMRLHSRARVYVEPFCGGMNVVDRTEGMFQRRIASDSNKYLIAMYKELINGWEPEFVSLDQYKEIRNNKDKYPDHLVGWCGFVLSFRGKWFGGYMPDIPIKMKTRDESRNFQQERIRSIKKQIPKLKDVEIQCCDYEAYTDVEGCLIYCDPPYKGTTEYKDKFNHERFYDWCRKVSLKNDVFISEYDMPSDFQSIWSKPKKSTLSLTKVGASAIQTVEHLFRIAP